MGCGILVNMRPKKREKVFTLVYSTYQFNNLKTNLTLISFSILFYIMENINKNQIKIS